MTSPPAILGGANVVLFSRIDHRHTPTEGCRHVVAGVEQGTFPALAICQYTGESSFYLFYCDGDWNVVTDTWHETLEDAMSQAEFEYSGIGSTWERPTAD